MSYRPASSMRSTVARLARSNSGASLTAPSLPRSETTSLRAKSRKQVVAVELVDLSGAGDPEAEAARDQVVRDAGVAAPAR